MSQGADFVPSPNRGHLAGLKPKHMKFVLEFVKDDNATQAAIRAGYSVKTAGQQAHLLLKRLDIEKAVTAERANIRHRHRMTVDRLVESWSEIANIDINDFVEIVRDPNDPEDPGRPKLKTNFNGKLVQEITIDRTGAIKLKTYDKLKAGELLGRHQRMFTDKIEHSGAVTQTNVNVDYSRLSPDELTALEKLLSKASVPGDNGISETEQEQKVSESGAGYDVRADSDEDDEDSGDS